MDILPLSSGAKSKTMKQTARICYIHGVEEEGKGRGVLWENGGIAPHILNPVTRRR
jgi:hypothetical protein